jgi:hypothetical protein
MRRLALVLSVVASLSGPVLAHAQTEAPPHRHRGHDAGMIITAIVMHDVGWVLGWLGVAYDEAAHACIGTCIAWPTAFVPVAGGFLASGFSWGPAFRERWDTSQSIGPVSLALEAAGLALLAIALVTTTDDESPSVSLVPSAPGALVGISVDGAF